MVRQCPFLGICLYHSNASYKLHHPQDEYMATLKGQGMGSIKMIGSVRGGWMVIIEMGKKCDWLTG